MWVRARDIRPQWIDEQDCNLGGMGIAIVKRRDWINIPVGRVEPK